MAFCPVCNADLGTPTPCNCANCGADFASNLAWKPLVRPRGKFRPMSGAHDLPRRSLGDRALTFLVRLALGVVIWSALAFLAAVSIAPYGRGSALLFFLLFLATIALPLWTLAALA
jgi:hypothetical protein